MLAAVGSWHLAERRQVGDPCDYGSTRWQQVWNPQARVEVEAAFAGSSLPVAADSVGRVIEAVDDYGVKWRGVHREICEATRVRGQQSDTLLDVRMECLDRRLGEWSALLARLAVADDDSAVRGSVEAVQDMVAPEACVTLTATGEPLPPEGDPARAVVLAQLNEVDRIRANYALADDEAAHRAALHLVQTATHPRVVALGKIWLARATIAQGHYPAGERLAREAMEAGRDAGDDTLIAQRWIALLGAVNLQARPADVLEWAEFARLVRSSDPGYSAAIDIEVGRAAQETADYAEARRRFERALAVVRRLERPRDVARVTNDLGNVLSSEAQYEAARQHYEAALALNLELLGSSHPSVAANLTNLGRVEFSAGRVHEAIGYHRRAVAVRERALGPEHLEVASSLAKLGVALTGAGELDEASGTLERALAIYERALEPDHWRIATTQNDLGNVAEARGQLDEARVRYEHALEIRLHRDPKHPGVAAPLTNLGLLAQRRGDVAGARALYQRAQGLLADALGSEHDSTLLVELNLVALLVGERKFYAAERSLEQVLRNIEAAPDPSAIRRADALTFLGETKLGLGRIAPAIATLEQALELRANLQEPPATGRTRCLLAVGLARAKDRARAVAAGRAALAELGQAANATDLQECQKRLRRVGVRVWR